MSGPDDTISSQIAQIARQAAPEMLRSIAATITATDWANWDTARLTVVGSIPHAALRSRVMSLLETWQNVQPAMTAASIAAAMRAAVTTAEQMRAEQTLDLIWTGPTIPGGAFRRTDQALIDVIEQAKQHLLMVSFVVYLTDAVAHALRQALARGVTVQFFLETLEADGTPMGHDTIQALGTIADRAIIYMWPRKQRSMDSAGRSGRMHVKCALADRQLLFLSSANLTGAALNTNMELGVLISGGPMPARVHSHFEQLISRGIVQRYQ